MIIFIICCLRHGLQGVQQIQIWVALKKVWKLLAQENNITALVVIHVTPSSSGFTVFLAVTLDDFGTFICLMYYLCCFWFAFLCLLLPTLSLQQCHSNPYCDWPYLHMQGFTQNFLLARSNFSFTLLVSTS